MPVPGCDQCGEDAVIFVRYSGANLCRAHLNKFIVRRVQQNIRKQMDVEEADGTARIVVAASGGKDSGTCLDILATTFRDRPDVEIIALTVDEGTDYRRGCIDVVKRLAETRNIRHEVRGYEKELGITLDGIVERIRGLPKSPCTYCGVLRRSIVNRAARELGAFRVATGLNLDDTAQTILMNLARGDLVRMARMAPHTRAQPGLVPRIQPLISIPEQETYLYASLNGIPVMEGTCPHRGDAMRNRFRKVIFELEKGSPGTRHAMLNSFFDMKEMLLDRYPPSELAPCIECNEPTVDRVCEACKLLGELK